MQTTYTTALSTTSGLQRQKELENGQKVRSFGQKEHRQTMPLEVAAGFIQRPKAGKPSFVLQSRTSDGKDHLASKAADGKTIRSRLRETGSTFAKATVDKEGGVTMRSIFYAYADSLVQEVTEFVNAFVILYRAEVI